MKRRDVVTCMARATVAALCAVALALGLPACSRSGSSDQSASATSEESGSPETSNRVLTFSGFDFSIPDHWQGPSSKSTDTMKYFSIDSTKSSPGLTLKVYPVNLDLSKANSSTELDAIQSSLVKNIGSAQLVSSTDMTIAGLPGRVFQYTVPATDGGVTLRCAVIIDAKNKQIISLMQFEEINAETSYLSDLDAIVSSVTVSSQPSSTPAPTEKTTPTTTTTTTNTGSETTYEGIYNEYTRKLQDATPSLIDEYNQEAAANTDGMTGLATICDKKISELAKINAEGTKKMAQLMYTSGNGSYQDYEDWAMKLSDVYTTEAQKITDAYTSSAM